MSQHEFGNVPDNRLKHVAELMEKVDASGIYSPAQPELTPTQLGFDIAFPARFNTEDRIRRGWDFVDLVGNHRYFFVRGSDPEVEELIRHSDKLGEHAILKRVHTADSGAGLFEVPQSASQLWPLIENPWYEADYTNQLTRRADQIIEALKELDPNAFGINTGFLCVANAKDPDIDTQIMIIPPVAKSEEMRR